MGSLCTHLEVEEEVGSADAQGWAEDAGDGMVLRRLLATVAAERPECCL